MTPHASEVERSWSMAIVIDRTPKIKLLVSWLTNPFGGICCVCNTQTQRTRRQLSGTRISRLAVYRQPLIDHGLSTWNVQVDRFSTVALFHY